MGSKLRLGISSCLLGNKVRYNGGHQLDRYITDTLGNHADFFPVCPEVECGLGVPRETLRLAGDPSRPRLVTSKSNIDHTERMQSWTAEKLDELEKEELHGFIFKSRSPSSGMERVKVYIDRKRITQTGVGMFAKAFMSRFPLVPVEEDGRLHDVDLRENFIERIFVFRRWRDLLKSDQSQGALVAFHTSHKLLVMAHSVEHYRSLGRLVAHGKEQKKNELMAGYESLLMEALQRKCTIKKHVNVLHHMVGYFKKHLAADEKKELLEVIEQFRSEYVPLIVPLTLIKHYVRKYGQEYLAGQMYLNPHPLELKLRNHA